ncbi:glycosyltransferase family 2 protein [Thomasclavelia cocleata]|uniref:glycosyltransferase family 2 protein n=1 Tax=Thomasclavelia cocleata TaxID=69824 RepID=UPI00248CAFF1|nr:glycosyltransferase family 2 protein [Thomasclavelia cocleata]
MCDIIKDCISVIVPVYNVEKYLGRCIESIIGQTYHNIEIILVDDGSTDDSLSICKEYAIKDDRIKIIHKENAGVSSARNVGLKNTKGEFITFVDSDDYIKLTCFEKMINGIKNNDVDMVVVGWEDEEGILGYINKNIDIDSKKIYMQDEISNLNFFHTVWGHLFKRINIKGQLFDEELIYGEDTLFAVQSFYKKNNQLLVIGEPLYVYMISRENSATNLSSNKKNMSLIKAYNEISFLVKPYKEMYVSAKNIEKDYCFTIYLKLLKNGYKNDKKHYYFLKYELFKLRLQGYRPKNKLENLVEILYIYFYPVFQYYLKIKK